MSDAFATCESCNDDGYLLDQTYGFTAVPDGACPVQRCDTCRVYSGDIQAARAAASFFDTSWGGNFSPRSNLLDDIAEEILSGDGEHLGPLAGSVTSSDPDSGTYPGDVWVWLPLDHTLRT